MRKLIISFLVVASCAAAALGQSQSAPTLRIVSEDGNNLPSELLYGDTKVKPLRLRPGTNQPITIADADFFVQQQYVDFLSRFPDESGFNFWVGQIGACAGNASCVQRARVNTSGAFFLSIEFNGTGYFVYRLHRASFGTLPRYAQFMPDTRTVGKDVIVGVGEWAARLEANRRDFANSWVNRSAFLAEFPADMSAAAYVDKLIGRTGLSAADVNRDALVADLAAGRETRATTLRKIIETPAYSAQQKNPAFVLLQYFGYLRRDPDAAPDLNLNGYNFWLQKLNNHGGDFVSAEMVLSFIVSQEYKARF